MSWELLAIIALSLAACLMVVFRKNAYVKKYWKYSIILLPAIVIIVLRMITNKKNSNLSHDMDESASALSNAIRDIKDDLNEANTVAVIEISAAKAKDSAKVEQLQEVVKIKDKRERRKRLADMLG